MDKAQRGELLRQRFKAKGGKQQPPRLASAKNPEASRAPFIGSWWGFSVNPRVKQWLTQPDEAKPTTLSPKRTAHPSALARIAQQLPRKLPRVIFPQ